LNGQKRSRTKLNGRQKMAFEGPIFVRTIIEIHLRKQFVIEGKYLLLD
jgi:hypothetical protein